MKKTTMTTTRMMMMMILMMLSVCNVFKCVCVTGKSRIEQVASDGLLASLNEL